MRTERCIALVATGLASWAFLACDHVGSVSQDGGVADADTDGDTDIDSDTDADTDGDTDGDTDPCGEVQPYCCKDECPCADPEDRCVATYSGGIMDEIGVCKPESEGAECWEAADCSDGEFCAGVSVCPCDMDCDWEGPGICSPVSGACCEDSSVDCPDDYFCLELDGTDTCHGVLQSPQCWTNDDCPDTIGFSCVGATLCPCDADCLSEPGLCSWDEK